jgi:hypothetical protein
MADSLSDRYAELLNGSYDCADRIVLNAYFRMGHGAGGFRVWWRTLTGSEDTLDNTHLMRMAGRFSRRIHFQNLRDKTFISYSHAADGRLAASFQKALQPFAKLG